MALIKTYLTPKGPVSYWIAGMIQIDNYNKTAYGRLYGFFSKEQCDMPGSVPLMMIDYNLTPDMYEYYFAKEIMVLPDVTPQTQFYTFVKDKPYLDELNNVLNFADAQEG